MKKTWNHQGIIEKFQANRNEKQAGPMKAYMKNHFPFLGIKSPLRKALMREQFLEYALPEPEALFSEAWKLYGLLEREYQYAAIGLIDKMKKHLTTEDFPVLRQFIETKSWWDSVDSIAPTFVGQLVRLDRNYGENVMLDWSDADNMWTNRSAILHQLKFKDQTDTDLLFRIVRQHAESNEFFIQKAIGWALREYAKTNPEAVREFVGETTLKPLSRREAMKHIG
ncbi:DNA alkylation repair protein [Sporosarcina thermotolerans]|uniref:DNA alkylation repair protein n=1 Tax=Sporosarcina thermotolerans TaxID=633404 RepID=A0AAW9ACD4_9BACL|nr:DNA alkylation repair protein [Sporosarcina thermotolerans]MDW0117700.1 DNA alkylation repair protein [Sporosarcina thermotolerans]WHT49212.1 DNA alkylation repair protein [Sporosarcina thermotolerans]